MHQLVRQKVTEVEEKEEAAKRELEDKLTLSKQQTAQAKILVKNVCTCIHVQVNKPIIPPPPLSPPPPPPHLHAAARAVTGDRRGVSSAQEVTD